jgi:hypothetical protein
VAIATVATVIVAVAIVASSTLVVSSAAIPTALSFVCTVSPMLIVNLFISLVVFELCVKLCRFAGELSWLAFPSYCSDYWT